MARVKKRFQALRFTAGTACASVLALSSAMADDTEVFFGQVDPTLDIFPNVLFVLDTSGSMNWTDGGSETRLERMKDALDTILDNTTNVNVGIMRFNGSRGGGSVLFPVTPIDEEICDQDDCGDISAAPRTSNSWADAEEAVSNQQVIGNDDVLNLGSSDSRGSEIVGLHFEDLTIPQGAEITSAWLEFTAEQSSNQSTELTIKGELSPNAVEFNGDNGNLSSRPTTSESVEWDLSNWNQGVTYQSDSVKDILQEIVDQNDWCGGNSAVMLITGSGERRARSFDRSATDAPTLRYTYDSSSIPNSGGCTQKTVVTTIASSSDDVEQRSNGRMLTRSRDIEMPNDRGNTQTIGLRFTDVKIPQGATVIDASVEFEVDRQSTGDVGVRIQAQAADNASTFSSNRWSVTSRTKTAASVDWDDLPSLPTNTKVTTPSITPVIQEVINRGGWQSGNALALIMSKKYGSSYRAYESFDSEPVNAAKLRIVYQAQAGGTQTTYITARDKLKEVVNGLTATGGTPLVDAYYEASRYYRGAGVDYGKQRGYYRNRFHRVSVPESYFGGTVSRDSRCDESNYDSDYCRYETILGSPTYISPFKSSCQTNHIVFLSDGAATSNSSASKVRALTGKSTCKVNSGAEACGEELAEWLFDNDLSNTFNGKQNVSTYTIGFNFSSSFLSKLASAGGGAYFQASSADQLVDVFQSILGDVLSVDTSFVAPGATVNQFNRLTHRDDIYFALFKPDQRPVWSGNLKRYRVDTDPATGKIAILDAAGKQAVDPTSGFFHEDSRSWWTTGENDGNQVGKGGAAAQMEFVNGDRQAYTFLGDYDSIPTGGTAINTAANRIHENNNQVTIDDLEINDPSVSMTDKLAYRESLLKWARGIDVQDEDEDGDIDDFRLHMGDPMHARPVILNYANGDSPYTSVFVGTNEGYLHAFERDGGTELFSYVPKELLKNFDTFWNNQSSDGHPYGLDGALSVWTTDVNENVTIDPGEEAYLYTGMRRGGNNYYALNVSDRLNPKLAWVIEGGVGDFQELGQTWSKASPTRIRYNGQERDVLIFGAGYDENQDWRVHASTKQTVPQSEDTKGRGIYIVDAKTGERIYAALGSNTGDQYFDEMDYSMPANVRILDVDFDGFADQLYTTDTGGQVWRFDFVQYHQSGDLLQGGVLAALGGNGLANERRFYYEPDVAVIANDGERFLSVSIGSGWRAHPLDLATNDRFYMIKTNNLYDMPAGYGKSNDGGITFTPITEDDLVDVTGDLTPPINNFGWMYDLGATGEKVLGTSITANNQVAFTSYRPALAVGACTTAIGGGSLYVLNILDGSPTIDLNGDGVIDENDREKQLAHGGIPPEPAVLITDDGPVGLAGPEQFDLRFVNLTRRTFWVDAGEEN